MRASCEICSPCFSHSTSRVLSILSPLPGSSRSVACRLSKLQPVLCALRLGRIGKCDGIHAPVCLFPRREERCRIACAAYDKLRSIRDTISVANGGQIDTLLVPRERLSAPAIVLEYSCWLGCIKQSQWLKKKVQMSSLNHAPPAHNNSAPSSLGLMQAPSGFPLSRSFPLLFFTFIMSTAPQSSARPFKFSSQYPK